MTPTGRETVDDSTSFVQVNEAGDIEDCPNVPAEQQSIKESGNQDVTRVTILKETKPEG